MFAVCVSWNSPPSLPCLPAIARLEEIEALNAGADAYLPMEEPLDQELLLAHASALMRRYLSANTRQAALIQSLNSA